MMKRLTGFTLIELMIVVAVMGIIAAIAYPSYTDSVRKSRRADAMQALLKLQLDQEKWRANHTSYTGTIDGTNCSTSVATGLCWSSAAISMDYYTISIVSPTTSTFTGRATAHATKSQNDDKEGGVACNVMDVNQDGPAGQLACWRKN